VLFEGLISSLLVLGITIGRLFGAKFVQRGRKLCLLMSIFISLVAIGAMMVLNIYIFLLARLIYGFGAGMFTAVAPRYVEECSPPQYLSLFFTIYTFGISLNRPFLMMADYILPKDKSEFNDTNTWRYFILVPAFFGACTIVGMLFVVRYDTPMFLISQQRFEEARNAIKHMFKDNHEQIFQYMKKNTSKETDKVTFKSALVDPRYRKGTYVAMTCALLLFSNGIFPFSTYGTRIFQKIYKDGDDTFTPRKTLNAIAYADPLSQLAGVFVVPLFPRKVLLVAAALVIGVLNALVGTFDITGSNLGVFIAVMGLVVLTSIIQEPVSQLYMTEVSNNASLGLAHFTYFGLNIVLSFVLPLLVDRLGPQYLYFIFAGAQFAIMLVIILFLKETSKLTDRDKKLLYVPEEYREEVSMTMSHIDVKEGSFAADKSLSFHHIS